MGSRVVLAGIAGGIAMFIWNFIAHDILPLGEIGIMEMPNEAALLGAMQTSLGNVAGLYFFPGMGLGANATAQQRQAAMSSYADKLLHNPSGILIYHPPGIKMMTAGQLAIEFGTDVVEALLATILLAQSRLLRYLPRVGFVVLIGVLAAIATNVSYWDWYGFPGNYTAGYVLTLVIGFFFVGLIAAGLTRARA